MDRGKWHTSDGRFFLRERQDFCAADLPWDRWLSGLAENCQMLGPHKLAPEEVSVSSYLPSSPFILIPGFSKTSGIKWTLKTQC